MKSLRRIKTGEGHLFREIRLAALKESPQWYGSTFESALERSDESWCQQADGTAEGPDRAKFLMFHHRDPVGLIAFYRHTDLPDVGEIFQLWIAPSFRGTGAAVELTEAALEWARQNRFSHAIAGVLHGNHRSRGLFRKLGFEISGERSLVREGQDVLIRKLQAPKAGGSNEYGCRFAQD